MMGIMRGQSYRGTDMTSNKVYCILGGGGSFGITLAHSLLDSGVKQVVGIGRSPLRIGPFSVGIERCPGFSYRQFHVLHELDMLLEYLDVLRPDVIVNFAAQGEGAVSWRHSWRFFDTNATALAHLYEELSRRNWFVHSGRFIQIGTSELYGSVTAPAREDAPLVPTSPYAASKAAFDMYLLAMAGQGRGAPMNIIRPSNCYCSGQLLHRIIPRAIVAGLTSQLVPLHGGGAAKKSYLHATDLARAIQLVAEDGEAGRVYNVGPDEPTSIRDVAMLCAHAVSKLFDEVFYVASERVGQDGCYWLDSSAIKELGWRQEIGWDEGLAAVRAWAEHNLDQLRECDTGYQLRA